VYCASTKGFVEFEAGKGPTRFEHPVRLTEDVLDRGNISDTKCNGVEVVGVIRGLGNVSTGRSWAFASIKATCGTGMIHCQTISQKKMGAT